MENLKFSLIPIEEFESRLTSKIDSRIDEIKSYIKEIHQNQNQNQNQNQDEILSFKEGCALLNIAEPTGYSKISKREIPFMKRGKFIYFSKKQLTEHILSSRRKTLSELEAEAKKKTSPKGNF